MVKGACCVQVPRFNHGTMPKVRREDVKHREGQNLPEVTQRISGPSTASCLSSVALKTDQT